MSEQLETWKHVTFAPLYEVSDMGRVRSWVLKGGDASWRARAKRRTEPRLVRSHAVGKERKSDTPYLSICLHRKAYKVHRLVLEVFVGPCPDGYQTAHLNGNRSDNRLVNLAWVTPAQNAAHKLAHGTDNATIAKLRPECYQRGEDRYNARLTVEKVREMRRLYPGLTFQELSDRFGVCPQAAYNAVVGRSWRHA